MISIPFYIILLIVLPIWVTIRRRKYIKNKRSFKLSTEILINIFFIYILGVAYLTLQPFHFVFPGQRPLVFDTSPFEELIKQFRRKVHGIPVYGLLYSVGNIFLFVPFGFLLPLIYRKMRNIIVIILCGFIFSFTIEVTQGTLTTIRSATVDDLIFNTVGAVIGYLFFKIIYFITEKIKLIKKY